MYSSPDYSAVALAIEKSDWAGSPAEAHGILCGQTCVEGADGAMQWLATMVDGQDQGPDADDAHAREAAETFRALAVGTCDSLESGDLSLELLLPPDSEPIHERAALIGSWCQGFLSGLGGERYESAAEVRNLLELPEISEVLGDLAEISKAGAQDPETDDDEEEQEAAYSEIVEYVRVSVQLIYETVVRTGLPELPTHH